MLLQKSLWKYYSVQRYIKWSTPVDENCTRIALYNLCNTNIQHNLWCVNPYNVYIIYIYVYIYIYMLTNYIIAIQYIRAYCYAIINQRDKDHAHVKRIVTLCDFWHTEQCWSIRMNKLYCKIHMVSIADWIVLTIDQLHAWWLQFQLDWEIICEVIWKRRSNDIFI